ncbi:LytR C-terminal domain-containing protein [Nocardioides sp. ChNu-153]|uniref:LytR C-terminal domain-containing protein n=1 Tax=unclassified Nocardioides TaxID=2615069 RepID=UPI002405F1C0|nr:MULTISPECIES: LytR C-terminal domain-containing protein [unclassified Nocardioides]MDF9717358.1 LytR C-terminal domain-containing protein [Nocardioides sp. ChNu-99]MDN7122399.1 LytR C-terminal domain-containing protein [Nocardioides sp. ChNu-153]
MSDRTSEGMSAHTRSAITLAVLVVVLLVGLVLGWNRVTAPVPSASLGGGGNEVCTLRSFEPGDALTTADVTVSVYNASGRSRLASQTMGQLTDRGFVAGQVGDAPEGAVVDRVEIRAAAPSSAAAVLVRENVGSPAAVVEDPTVDGIVVYVGPSWQGPTGDARGDITVANAEEVCGPQETALP